MDLAFWIRSESLCEDLFDPLSQVFTKDADLVRSWVAFATRFQRVVFDAVPAQCFVARDSALDCLYFDVVEIRQIWKLNLFTFIAAFHVCFVEMLDYEIVEVFADNKGFFVVFVSRDAFVHDLRLALFEQVEFGKLFEVSPSFFVLFAVEVFCNLVSELLGSLVEVLFDFVDGDQQFELLHQIFEILFFEWILVCSYSFDGITFFVILRVNVFSCASVAEVSSDPLSDAWIRNVCSNQRMDIFLVHDVNLDSFVV